MSAEGQFALTSGLGKGFGPWFPIPFPNGELTEGA